MWWHQIRTYFSQCWGSALDRLLASPGLPHLHSAGCQANLEHVGQLVYLPTWFFIPGFFVAWWSQDPEGQKTDRKIC